MHQWRPGSIVLCAVLLAACQRPGTPAAPSVSTPTSIATPAFAMQALSRHLRDNDLQAFARDAVPPELHEQLEAAWRAGRTRWPLQELPFDGHLPGLMAALAAPAADMQLLQTFEQQFAGQDRQIHSAAEALAVFGLQYLQDRGDFSQDERAHYAQLVRAASRWGQGAPLGDRGRARQAIAQLTVAARQTGLGSKDAFRSLGMQESLRRMGPFAAAFKHVLVPYGLDLDASLDGMQVKLQQQTGDNARLRMRYTLGLEDIDTVVAMQRIDGRWYLADYLRHARAAIAQGPAAGVTTAHGGPGDPRQGGDGVQR